MKTWNSGHKRLQTASLMPQIQEKAQWERGRWGREWRKRHKKSRLSSRKGKRLKKQPKTEYSGLLVSCPLPFAGISRIRFNGYYLRRSLRHPSRWSIFRISFCLCQYL